MAFELLSDTDIRNVLKKGGERLREIHIARIQQQKQVDGSAYPHLKDATIKAKRRLGDILTTNVNADKRMIRTGDFMNNAFRFEVRNKVLMFTISKAEHNWEAIAMKRIRKKQEHVRVNFDGNFKAYEKSSGRDTFEASLAKYNKFSYRDLALWHLKGNFDIGKRSKYNPGINFFGLSEPELKLVVTYIKNEAAPLANAKLKREIRNAVNNANQKS